MMHIGQDVASLSLLTVLLCHTNNEEKSRYESILNLRTEFLNNMGTFKKFEETNMKGFIYWTAKIWGNIEYNH